MCLVSLCTSFIKYACGCAVNRIGDVGAQSIGEGLKSLTSLMLLDLSGECYAMLCVPGVTAHLWYQGIRKILGT